MPSDERVQQALAALAATRTAFGSAVAQAADEVRALLAAARADSAGGNGRPALELGAFAAGRIDAERFAALFATGTAVDAAALAALERSLAILEETARWSESGFAIRIDAGHDLAGEVAGALALAGRAFGSARAVQLARTNRFRSDEHAALLRPFPPERWNRAERAIAPPLVVSLAGAALRAEALVQFLEGSQKLVLVVDPPAPPAALVRLITPGLLVAQTTDPAELGELLAFEGPAVIALMPEGAARFVHDPRKGPTLAARLDVQHLPAEDPRGALGGLSAFRRGEELRQLAALRDAGAAAARAADAPVPAEVAAAQPADQLAAWLLRQADLSDA
jgi:hypothetical protein